MDATPSAWKALSFAHPMSAFSHPGSVGEASGLGSGHDLIVREFEPHVQLCANSSEPGAFFGFCVSLSLCPSLASFPSLSLSQK